jgi:hypothetical protein
VQVAVLPLPQQGWFGPPQPEQLPPMQVPAAADVPQIWPGPTHEPPKQQPPSAQTSPVQQVLPGPPQVLQKALTGSQASVGLLQTPLAPTGDPGGGGQQGSPACVPQRPQKFRMQPVPLAVHICPGQQGWPVPPQLPHAPAMQRAPSGAQVSPSATHMPKLQQPLPLQPLLRQQAWPGAPHGGSAGASRLWVVGGPSAMAPPPSGDGAPTGRPLLLQAERRRSATANDRGERSIGAHYPPR